MGAANAVLESTTTSTTSCVTTKLMLTRFQSIRQEDFLDRQGNSEVNRPPRVCLHQCSGTVRYHRVCGGIGRSKLGDFRAVIGQTCRIVDIGRMAKATWLVRRTIQSHVAHCSDTTGCHFTSLQQRLYTDFPKKWLKPYLFCHSFPSHSVPYSCDFAIDLAAFGLNPLICNLLTN